MVVSEIHACDGMTSCFHCHARESGHLFLFWELSVKSVAEDAKKQDACVLVILRLFAKSDKSHLLQKEDEEHINLTS